MGDLNVFPYFLVFSKYSILTMYMVTVTKKITFDRCTRLCFHSLPFTNIMSQREARKQINRIIFQGLIYTTKIN